MHTNKGKYEIAKEAFIKKKGFISKFSCWLYRLSWLWKIELSKEDYDKILYNMAEFFETVPMIPNALRGIDEADTIKLGGSFDKAAEYNHTSMTSAAEIFGSAAPILLKSKKSSLIISQTNAVELMKFTRGRKQKVNGKGGLLWKVRSEKTLILQSSDSNMDN